MSRMLIAITTFKQSEVTDLCLMTLRKAAPNIDLAVFDDHSGDQTESLCQKYGAEFFGRPKPEGLTYSWNEAYRIFLERGYDHILISNNDVLFPVGAVEELVRILDEYPLVGVLTRKNDSPDWNPIQAVETHYGLQSEFVDEPANYQEVQDRICSRGLPPIQMDMLHGFCFGLSRRILKYEFQPGVLFNPANRMVGQERDLAQRLKPFMLCRRAFVYHFQGKSFGPYPLHKIEYRENMFRYHKWLRLKHPLRWLMTELRFRREKNRFFIRKVRAKIGRVLKGWFGISSKRNPETEVKDELE